MPTGNRYSEDVKNEARKLRSEGWSYRKIADKFGTHNSTVQYWCKNITYDDGTKANLDILIEQIINDPIYDIREDGTIWTLKDTYGKQVTSTWRRCDIHAEKKYRQVKYNYKLLKVHRIIYRKFKGKLDANFDINHIDGKHDNNIPDNLELVTSQQNIKHSVENKLHCFGEKVGTSVLTEDIVKQIRKMFYKEGLTKNEIQKSLNLTKTTVWDVCEFNSWKHVTDY